MYVYMYVYMLYNAHLRARWLLASLSLVLLNVRGARACGWGCGVCVCARACVCVQELICGNIATHIFWPDTSNVEFLRKFGCTPSCNGNRIRQQCGSLYSTRRSPFHEELIRKTRCFVGDSVEILESQRNIAFSE